MMKNLIHIEKVNPATQIISNWILEMNPENLKLSSAEDSHEVLAELGYQAIAQRFFKSEIPTEAETEYAINFIEDVLMANKALPHHFKTLSWKDPVLQEIFDHNELQQAVVTRQNVEDLFTVFARVVMGAPGSFMKVEVTAEGFARLLIVRELLHHLDIETMVRI